MARHAEGWTLYTDPRNGFQICRFTWQGKRHNISTRERDPASASEAAARIYADVIAGRAVASQRRASSIGPTVSEIAALWANGLRLSPETVAVYAMYAQSIWNEHFRMMDAIDDASVSTYIITRLGCVTRSTVCKELSALRGFLRWCKVHGHLSVIPHIESPPASTTGTRSPMGTRQTVELSEEELDRVLEAMPERTGGGRGGNPARAFFTVLAETGLRRSTLFRLHAPGDYYPGRSTLRIRGETDKARFHREVAITARARAVLDAVCPEVGPIFKRVDYRETIRRAGRDAGLEPHRAARLSFHDFRHARTTHLLERTKNLAGVAYLLGHTNITTTNRYVRPNQRAGEAALADAFRPPSGHRARTTSKTKKKPKPKSPRGKA